MSGVVQAIKSKINFTQPKFIAGAVAVLALVGFLVYKFVFAPSSDATGTANAAEKRGAVSGQQQQQPSEQEKQLWLAERRAEEKAQMRQAAEEMQASIAQINEQLRLNYQEAVQNQQACKATFSTSKSSYDDDLSGMEEEQNINTSFLLKDDLDGKKQGMIKLGQELGKQKEYLSQDMREAQEKLMRLNQEWMQMFPGEQPLVHTPPPPSPQQQQQQSAPPMMQSKEEQAAMRSFYDAKNPMMPDGIMDGTGRESLPT